MLLGIIIGICIWQLVVGFAQFSGFDENWIKCPLFCLLWTIIAFLIAVPSALLNWKAYLYLFSLKINPFWMKLSVLDTLSDEQKRKLLSYCRGRYYTSLSKMFRIK